jgi:thiamine-phosphate pyrophosphorylase
MILARFYAIVDAEVLRARGIEVREFCLELRVAGVSLVQWRDKVGSPQEVLADAAVLREVLAGRGCRLIMNDRADLAVLAGFGGVHVGQGDLLPEEARRIVGLERLVGVSTHTDEQVQIANVTSADYIAVGPVFATATKLDAEPVIGLEGVRRARALTKKPLVAIGGITRANARSVIDAGADSVAVISALFVEGETVEKVARDFLGILR